MTQFTKPRKAMGDLSQGEVSKIFIWNESPIRDIKAVLIAKK